MTRSDASVFCLSELLPDLQHEEPREPMLAQDRLLLGSMSILVESCTPRTDCFWRSGGMPDHLHCLVSLRQQTPVSDALRLIKANSSKWIHETFDPLRGFAWQTGYGAFSVSFSQIPSVRKYLQQQQEHHRTTSFQDEFPTFLRNTISRSRNVSLGLGVRRIAGWSISRAPEERSSLARGVSPRDGHRINHLTSPGGAAAPAPVLVGARFDCRPSGAGGAFGDVRPGPGARTPG